MRSHFASNLQIIYTSPSKSGRLLPFATLKPRAHYRKQTAYSNFLVEITFYRHYKDESSLIMNLKYCFHALLLSVLFLSVSCSKDDNSSGTNEPEIEVDVDDPISCQSTTGANYIVIEAEATDSDLGEWQLISKGKEGYKDNSAVSPINETHLEFTGNNTGSGPANSPLEYIFTAPSTGTYKLLIRLFQRLEGLEEDKCNDVYVKLAGDFTTATDKYTTEELKNNMKFFGRGVDNWGSCYSGESDGNHVKSAIIYNLKEGEQYTFTMSGRSQRTNIDYILLYDTDLNIKGGAHKDIAELNDAQYLPNWDCTQN